MSAATLLLGAMAAGTTMSISGQLQQGREAELQGKKMEAIAKSRADILRQNALAVRNRAVEEAKIRGERGRKLLARQTTEFAAGNVLVNVGSPLVVEAQTKADIAKDIGFVLEEGRVESRELLSQAAYEEAYGAMMKKRGKAARKQSKWNAIATGIQGFGTMAYMGYQGGYFGGKTGTGLQRPLTGPMNKGYKLTYPGW